MDARTCATKLKGFAVAKPEWGTKRTCRDCGAHFYDLKRKPITCPSCQAVHPGERTAKPRRTPTPSAKKAVSAAPANFVKGAEDLPVAAGEIEKTDDPGDSDIDNPDAAEEADMVLDGDNGDDKLIEDDIKLDEGDNIADNDKSPDETETI